MRVIGGKAKGHRLLSPLGVEVRPTTDRVKEAVFNSIQQFIADANVLDLFAGAGTLGIEALSRYAKQAYFVDSSSKQVNLIKKNLMKTKSLEEAVLICSDIYSAIDTFSQQDIAFDLIFMDPPYNQGFVQKTLEKIGHTKILATEGIIIVEHNLKEIPPLEVGCLQRTSTKKYGSTGVTYFKRREE